MKYLSSSLIVLFVLHSFVLPCDASAMNEQGKKLVKSRISISCVQSSDESVQLISKLRYRQDRQYYDISNAEVIFYTKVEDEDVEIGKEKTDDNGDAVITIKSFDNFIADEDSYYTIYVLFEGDDEYRGSDSELQFKRAKVDLDAKVIDSIYTLHVSAYELNEDNTSVGEQDVFVMVPRMFSNLTIVNDYSNEEGKMKVIFPSDIPADLNGSLEIIVQIPDTDDFGTLESRIMTDWGLPLKENMELASRELWSPDAPFWMLITFIILMGLVWGHFGVIAYKLYLIKKEGAALKNEF